MVEIKVDGAFFRVIDPAFELVIPNWTGMDPESAREADATIELPDGTRRYATFMHPSAITEVMSRHQESGESLGGRYFVCTNLVVIRDPGFATMADAVRDLIDTGDITTACGLVEPEGEDPHPRA
jgi:hypothetical protein